MRLIDAFAALKRLELPAFTTNDAAAEIGVPRVHASKILARLAAAHQIVRLTRGLWGFSERIDPLLLPQILTAPLPSYVSLQTALYRHGMIEQIPERVYAVSPARSRVFTTPIGTASIHHVAPAFFTGFETVGRDALCIATPEKALVDLAYFGPARSRLFAALPELELPARFSMAKVRRYLRLIAGVRRRIFVMRRLEALIGRGR
jgi:predicted transcriptional regulator of viral defense system